MAPSSRLTAAEKTAPCDEKFFLHYLGIYAILDRQSTCRCSSMAECQLPKLNTRVRFPSPAPKKKHLHSRCFFFGYLGFFKFLGRSEFALRRGFAFGKTLERRKSGAAQKGRWARCGKPIENLKYLDCSDLPQSRYNLDILGRTPRVSRGSDFFYCSKSVVCVIDIFQ